MTVQLYQQPPLPIPPIVIAEDPDPYPNLPDLCLAIACTSFLLSFGWITYCLLGVL